MVADECLLHRVEGSVLAVKVFDGRELPPVQDGDELDAGVNRPVLQPALAVADLLQAQ